MTDKHSLAPAASGPSAAVPALIVGLVIGAAAAWMFLSMKPKGPAKEDTKADLGAGMIEYPIGKPVEKNHMSIAAVWLPPITMNDDAAAAGDGPIHIECDVKALEGNPNGFPEGAWIPYLTVEYALERIVKPGEAAGFHQTGALSAMVAKDGPHYGVSLQLSPHPARYKLTYKISPPSRQGFGRHADKISGVAPWWEPFEVSWEFDYVPHKG